MNIVSWLLDRIDPFRPEESEFTVQARADQKYADHPGCVRGFMECRNMICLCNGSRPSREFVKARAIDLEQESTVDAAVFKSTRGDKS